MKSFCDAISNKTFPINLLADMPATDHMLSTIISAFDGQENVSVTLGSGHRGFAAVTNVIMF